MSGEFGSGKAFGLHGEGFDPTLHVPRSNSSLLGEVVTSLELAVDGPKVTDLDAVEKVQPYFDNPTLWQTSPLRLVAAVVLVSELPRVDDGAETFPYHRPHIVAPGVDPGSGAAVLRFPRREGFPGNEDPTLVLPLPAEELTEPGEPTVVLKPVAQPDPDGLPPEPTEILEPLVLPAGPTDRFAPVRPPLFAGDPLDGLGPDANGSAPDLFASQPPVQ